jgi:hypothetical protein
MLGQTVKLKLAKPGDSTSGWGEAVTSKWDALDPIVAVSGSKPGVNDVAQRQMNYVESAGTDRALSAHIGGGVFGE